MGKFSAYKLPLKSLGAGIHEYDYHLTKQFFVDMENSDIRDAALDVHLVVDYHGDFYDLTFTVGGEVVLPCDRCLDDLHYPIEASYHIAVKYGDDYNDENDDLLIIPESDNYLNVAYMIYDTVVLAIPIKHVHPMGKCNRQMSALLKKHRAAEVGDDADLAGELIDEMDSIEDTDATDRGTGDPRWDALRKMSADDTNKSE